MRFVPTRALALAAALLATLSVSVAPAGAARAAAPRATTVAAEQPALAASAATPDPAHPYSDPVWFPLRDPARVSCVLDNCTNPIYHGHWAIDWLGTLDAPVHPAGAGVFHIGAISATCPTSGVTA